ncbi:MAG: thiol:disulfide interchange protein DsbG [Alphaproteobacteria bacterium]|nr:thiol:disulfide interchange protein DsbG [Alphaproteobacteria bacterium]
MIRLLTVFVTLLTLSAPAIAAESTALPEMPPPIRSLSDEGAQIRYLGRDYGLDSWLAIKNGQEQYFYVLPGGEAFVMGVLFDKDGKAITVEQVRRLQQEGDNMLDTLAAGELDSLAGVRKSGKNTVKFSSPAEQLYNDIENANWVPLGKVGAPVIYSFIDPQCPHCHSFINDLKDSYIDKGRVQVRIVPVGFRDETKAQAAYLIAAPDPQGLWFRHMEGDKTALPAKAEINQQGVQRNLAIMQTWKFDVTPLIVYRAKDGTVKLVRGRPKDIPALIADLGARG